MATDTGTQREMAEYISAIACEMQAIADRGGLPILAYLLSLVVMEATDTLARSNNRDESYL